MNSKASIAVNSQPLRVSCQVDDVGVQVVGDPAARMDVGQLGRPAHERHAAPGEPAKVLADRRRERAVVAVPLRYRFDLHAHQLPFLSRGSR